MSLSYEFEVSPFPNMLLISWVPRRPRYDKINSTKTQERQKRGCFCASKMEEREGLYNNCGENMNGRTFNEGWQRMREDQEPKPNFRV